MHNGVDEFDVVAPFEILVSTGFEVELVTLERCANATGAHGMTLTPGGVLGSRPDLLIVPDGRWASKAPDSAWGEVRRGVIPSVIADQHARGTRIAGVCTGAMLMAASGILRGRPAVTRRSALDDLRGFGVQVHLEARVVDDGDVLTSGGVTAGIDWRYISSKSSAVGMLRCARQRASSTNSAAPSLHGFPPEPSASTSRRNEFRRNPPPM